MSKANHELYSVTSHPDGGWSGVCTCGRWAHAGAASERKLKDQHKAHIREAGGGR